MTIKEDNTVAQSTLHPQSGSVSKGDLIQKLVDTAMGMGVTDLSDWLTKSLAIIGHEADVIPASAAQNQATIAAKSSPITKEDLDAIFAGDTTISEEIKTKFASLFEAAVAAAVVAEVAVKNAALEEKYNTALAEEVEKTKTQIDDYMNYVVKEWKEENKIAIESELKVEIQEEFIEGLKNLFKEHYIEVPDEKLDVLAAVNEEVEQLKAKLNESENKVIELNKTVNENNKVEAIRNVCEGLTVLDAEKVKNLAEDIQFNDVESYSAALKVLKEKYITKTPAPDTGLMTETFESEENTAPKPDPRTSRYVAAINRTAPDVKNSK